MSIELKTALQGFRVVSPQSRATEALEEIRSAILSGSLTAGQVLPERDLAEALGISKTPVREALRVLAQQGLVDFVPYKGAQVHSPTEEELRALAETRALLEPTAAALSLIRDPEETISGARERLEEITRVLKEDPSALVIANRAFHRALYRNCSLPALVQALDSLHDITVLSSALGWRMISSTSKEFEEHEQMFLAAEQRKPALLAQRVYEHIRDFCEARWGGPLLVGPPSIAEAGLSVDAANEAQ
jgi:DNA-binding GntR family transcriptional regulator